MKIKRLSSLCSAIVLGLSSLMAVAFPQIAHAASGQALTWCGANNANFSTATNWAVGNDVSCSGNSNTTAYPGSDGTSDTLVFDLANVPNNSSLTANDDISSLTISTLEFTGGNGTSDGYGYDLSGSGTITVTAGVTDNSVPESGGSTIGGNSIAPIISAGGNPTIFSISSGSFTTFISVSGSNNITVQGGGTAAFSTTGTASSLANYTGTISSSDGSMIQLQNDLSGTYSSGGSVDVSGTSILDLSGGSCKTSCTFTYNLPMNLAGSGTGKDCALNLDGFQGVNITNDFSGTVTLNSDICVTSTGSTTINFTGPTNFNSYYIKDTNSPNVVTINVASGSNYSTENPNVGDNVTFFDDGTVGNATVASGGLLKGNGTLASANVQSGGSIAPGHSPGCLTITGNFTLSGSLTEDIQSPGQTACTDYDQVVVSGTVDLTGGSLNTQFLSGYSPSVGQSYEIIKNQGGSPVTGTFSGLAEGAVFAVGTTKLQITYKGAGGNNVVLTVVSPSTPTTATPGTPNTGFGLASTKIALPLIGGLLIAAGLVIISRRVNFNTRRN